MNRFRTNWHEATYKGSQILVLVGVMAAADGLFGQPASKWIFIVCSAIQAVFGWVAYNATPKKKR